MMNNIKKALLNQEPQTLKALNNLFHFDFCKKVDFLQINGRFTVKQIIKAADAAGYTPNDSTIAIITTGARYNEKYLYIATLEKFEKVNIEYKTSYSYSISGARCWLDDYYTKASFEDIRKQENITTYIICQKKADHTPENPHPVNLASRFKVENVRKWCYSTGGASYIGEIETRRTDDNGSKYTYNNHGRYIYKGRTPEYITIDEVIDKSGYIVNRKRNDLKQRAAALRAERAKAAYIASDNTEKINELYTIAAAKKAELIEALTEAATGDEITRIGNKLSRYTGLGEMLKDIETLHERDSRKEYSSPESFQNAYSRILDHLNEL